VGFLLLSRAGMHLSERQSPPQSLRAARSHATPSPLADMRVPPGISPSAAQVRGGGHPFLAGVAVGRAVIGKFFLALGDVTSAAQRPTTA
jgi:hypothetical protein